MGNKQLQQLIFAHRDDAVEEALKDYAGDVQRISSCLQAAGYHARDKDIAAAWLYHSGGFAATWLTLPDDDRELIADLLEGTDRPLTPAPSARHQWRARLTDAGDGSGDQILELPDDLMAALVWAIDDALEIRRLPNGDIQLRKIG